MNTLRFALVVLALAFPNAARAGETTLAEVLGDPVGFDGQQVQVRGTLSDLRAQRSRKGDRYYTFSLSEGERTIPILVSVRPGCAAGSRVTVYGTVKRLQSSPGRHGAVLIDATVITCLGMKESRSDALAAPEDGRHHQPTASAGK